MSRLAWPLLLTSVLAGACTSKGAEPQTKEATLASEPAPEPTSEIEVKPTTAPTLELPALPTEAIEPPPEGYALIVAGEEPRSPLRLRPQASPDQLRLTLSMTVEVGGTAMPPMRQALPPFERLTRAEPPTLAGGRITQRLRHGSGHQSDPMDFEQTLVLDERGARLESHTTMPEGVDPKLRRSLETLAKTFEQLLVVLPAEPIGVGAKWRVSTPFENGGLSLEQIVEFELVERQGDRVEITAQIHQRSRTNKFTPPNQGNELELSAFESRGAGRMIYELGRPLPEALSARIETSFSTKASSEAAQELSFAMTLELGLARVLD